MIIVCSSYIMPSTGFTCSSSSGKNCFRVFDEDLTSFWTSEWLSVEKDRYAQGFVSWIEISFNEKLTVSRLDFVRQSDKPGGNDCSNFAEVELSFDDHETRKWSLKADKNKIWQDIKISPNVDTTFIKISDLSGKQDEDNFCESAIAEIRVWGCNSDYIQHETGRAHYILSIKI